MNIPIFQSYLFILMVKKKNKILNIQLNEKKYKLNSINNRN